MQVELSQPTFLQRWLDLPIEEAQAVLVTLRKLRRLNWVQLYADTGLKWEAVQSRSGPGGRREYTLRITRKIRAVGYREGDTLRLLSLHSDHDSAYH